MKNVVCTLFEGHYHYGVAGLINSLYAHGFKGEIFAGYRGELPGWADMSSASNDKNISRQTLKVADDLVIHFIKVKTDYHFTNYKSHFLLSIWNGPAKNADNLFYFDPDIVNICAWSFYEQWVTFGVALIHEIVWNDMPANHPKRAMWSHISDAMSIEVRNKLTSNINAGFVGLGRANIEFLELWSTMIDYAIAHFGVDGSKFAQGKKAYSLFTVADQDLLNLTAMCSKSQLSEMGAEAMGFTNSGWTMCHATGTPKPWKKNFLTAAFSALPPSKAEKEYWNYANGIIRIYSESIVKYKKFTISVASFIGRFYRKY